MAKTPVLETPRLFVHAGTITLAQAELNDTNELARLLNADLVCWPPPLNDADSMKYFADFIERHPHGVGWGAWYIVRRATPESSSILIGNGGFKGMPDEQGTVEVGYSIIEQFQRQGYATEAVNALLKWAFSHQEVRRVIAHTLPDLTPSQKVLEKCGFVFVGEGMEEGAILFELKRPQ